MHNEPVSTTRLIKMLSDTQKHDALQLLSEIDDHMTLPTLSAYLQSLIDEREVAVATLFEQAGLERTTGYRILSGSRAPGRNVLLRLALLMGLDVEQTQYLLKTGGKSVLYPRVRRDALLIFAIAHHLPLTQTEDMLQQIGERSLYEKI